MDQKPKELTWPDVAHYYLATHSPMVHVYGCKGYEDGIKVPLMPSYFEVCKTGVPDLREFDSMTEEEAQEYFALYGEEWDAEEDGSCREFIIEGPVDYFCPEQLHWLISKGFNVFNVPSYKEEIA